MLDLKVGDIVFVERYPGDVDKQGKLLSDYDSGEKIVTGVGVDTFRACKFGSGYDLSNETSYSTKGPNRWRIANRTTSAAVLKQILNTLDEFQKEANSEKRHWIGTVYDNAAARRLTFDRVYRDMVGTPKQEDEPQLDGIVIDGRFYAAPPGMKPMLVGKLD